RIRVRNVTGVQTCALPIYLAEKSENGGTVKKISKSMKVPMNPLRSHVVSAVRKSLRATRNEDIDTRGDLKNWLDEINKANSKRYHSHLYSESELSPLNVTEIKPQYNNQPEEVDGRVVLRDNFDKLFE